MIFGKTELVLLNGLEKEPNIQDNKRVQYEIFYEPKYSKTIRKRIRRSTICLEGV